MNKLKKLDKILGTKSEVKEKKSLRLLSDILNKLEKSNDFNDVNSKELSEVFDRIRKNTATSNGKEKELISAVQELNELLNKNLLETNNVKLDALLKELINVCDREFPTEINVSNQKEFPTEIKVSNPVTEIKVTNIKDARDRKVEITNFPEQKEFPKKITVDNFPEQKEFPTEIKVSNQVNEVKVKKPIWYKQFTLTQLTATLTELITSAVNTIKDSTFKINASRHENPDKALAVKLIDKDGKVIKDLFPRINLPGGSGGGNNVSQLLNSDKAIINPATEDKQNDIIDGINALDINTDELESGQDVHEELLRDILRELKHLNLQVSFMTDTTLSDEDKIDN